LASSIITDWIPHPATPSSAMASRNKMSDISLLQLPQCDQAASNVNSPLGVIRDRAGPAASPPILQCR
jgi:hypothetical protein